MAEGDEEEGKGQEKKPGVLITNKNIQAFLSPEAVAARRQKLKDTAKSGYSQGWAAKSVPMVIIPPLIFVAVLQYFFLYYHTGVYLCHLLSLSIVLVSFVAMASDWNSVRGGKWYMYFGFLCGSAAITAALCGIYCYRSLTYFHYAMGDKRTYTNVLPTEPANSVRDASKIYFAIDAAVDVTRSVGFKAQGHVFCVAPILDQNVVGKVNFWAAGLDCCKGRQGFECDGAWDRNTHGGAVVLDELRPRMALAELDMFRHAARQASAVYEVVSDKNPIFVRWMGDPSDMEAAYYEEGKQFCKDVMFWAIPIWIILGVFFSYQAAKLAQEQKQADKMRAIRGN